VRFVADFARTNGPIASICHGPWVLVEAGIVDGRTITSWPSLQTDVRNAGGTWVNEGSTSTRVPPAVVTSGRPDDVPAFSATAIEQLAAAAGEGRRRPTGAATS
jgi:protease I